MVHFGKHLLAAQYPPWKDHYLDYNQLKRMLEEEEEGEEDYNREDENCHSVDEVSSAAAITTSTTLHKQRRSVLFQQQLNAMIEHAVLFSLEQQGRIAQQLQSLQRDKLVEIQSKIRRHAPPANAAVTLGEFSTSSSVEKSNATRNLRTSIQDLRQDYRQVGSLVLELVRFTELNLTGIRKILKKHDRLYVSPNLTSQYFSEHVLRWEGAPAKDSHLNQWIQQQGGFGALVVSIQNAFFELQRLETTLEQSTMFPTPRRNLTETNLASTGLPMLMDDPGQYQQHTGSNLTSSSKQLERQNSRSRTTTDLLSLGNMVDRSSKPNQKTPHEPILFRIEMARNRLHSSSRFVQMLAAPAATMLLEEENEYVGDDHEHAMLLAASKSAISNFLNLLSTFLYITNYYIAAPTSGSYAAKVHGSEALAGAVIGMTSFAALAGTLLYSWWTSYSYKAALTFAACSAILGNLLYALALPYESLMLVLVGRLFIGFGSCRSINRRYIADSYTREERTAASAAFVTAGSLGMAVGPAVAALLDFIPDGNRWISVENAPGWIMFGLWIVYLITLVLYFRDPPRSDVVQTTETIAEDHGGEEARPLLLSTAAPDDESTEKDYPLWRNGPVMATLFLAFLLKMILECSLSSAATITSFYFDWSISKTGVYLALLGLLMFPANLLISWLSSKRYEDRALIFGALCFLMLGTFGIIDYGSQYSNYREIQYITFGVVIFVACNALEGPNMSLLSKIIPRRFARGFFNMGLLVTEAGTFGRTVGDGVISVIGLGSIPAMLNDTFALLGAIVTLTVIAMHYRYSDLEVPDDELSAKPVPRPNKNRSGGRKKPVKIPLASSMGIISALALTSSVVSATRIFDFETDFGGIPDDNAFAVCAQNSARLARALNHNVSGNLLHFAENQTYFFHHGMVAEGLHDAVLQIDGTLRFERADLAINKNTHPFPACLTIVNGTNLTVTSERRSSRGIIDGQGSQWWGLPLLGYLKTVERRPRLLRFNQTRNLLIENIILQNSAYHGLYLDAVHDVEVRNMSIVARRTEHDGHSWVDLTAFNTDGIDVSGTNIHVHDVDIWSQDDCIAVKDVSAWHSDERPVSANMVFERVNASGLGFVVGSIMGTHVHNITFLNSYLYKPVKGVYMKLTKRVPIMREANRTALIEDVNYVNITMVAPQQWPIWIGPAQQADNRNICHPNPCSLCWPMTPGSKCNVVPHQRIRRINLKNIQIFNPSMATGVLLGSPEYPLENLTLDNVRVKQGIPPLMARRPISESFPGTMLPVHDPYVPPEYATKIQRKIVGVYGWIAHLIVSVGGFVQRLIEKMHLALVWRVAQTQQVQTWYLSYLSQAFLNTVWVWIAMALGFATAGVFSFRGWTRYRKIRRARVAAAAAANTADDGDNQEDTAGAVEMEDEESERIVSRSGSMELSLESYSLYFHHPRIETRWPPVLCHLGYFLLLLLCWGGAIYTGTFPFRKPVWERTYRYYACRSVINGIAKGNTWPVPYCFKKEHSPWWPSGDDNDDDSQPSPHHHHRHRHGSDHFSPHKVTVDTNRIVITACLALFVLAFALLNHWRRQHGRLVRRENEDSNAGVPEYSPIPSFVTIEGSQENEAVIHSLEDSTENEDDALNEVNEQHVNALTATQGAPCD